jgi:metal-responsive CopG/Arc/MetJ family transcriptional regulator
MLRKTVTINDSLYNALESTNIIKQYSSFSELVSNALEVLIEKNRKEQYKKAMLEASKDKLYLQDMKEIEEDFKYADWQEK